MLLRTMMEGGSHLLYFHTALLLILGIGSQDPCSPASHVSFPRENLGRRNEICETKEPTICDYYLQETWYVVENASILDRCPTAGNCGVAFPTWMDGAFPTVGDGIVNRTACVNMHGDCCEMNVTISVKNCTAFYVYRLPPLHACPMAYCFESELPCEPPTTTTTPGSTATTNTDSYITTKGQERTTDRHESCQSKDSSSVIAWSLTGVLLTIISCTVVICVWLWKTGRLRCKRPSSGKTRKSADVVPYVTNVTYMHTMPPAYSEK